MLLYFIFMPGCGACDQAKPELKKWLKQNPGAVMVGTNDVRSAYQHLAANPNAVVITPVDITTAQWKHEWQPEVTPTYVIEVPRRQRIQYQGTLMAAEIPKFIAKAKQMMGFR
jgi:hypothetical protein